MAQSPDHPELQFVQAKRYATGRPDGPPLWIVVHDMEAAETRLTAENTAHYFATLSDGRSVSSHYCADNDSVVQCVLLKDTAFTVGNRAGNYRGINWEFSGFASQTREQWLDEFGKAMFAQAAPIIRADAQRFGIPLSRRSVPELRSFVPGVTSHNDLRLAFGGTTHTDPGPNFPWDYFMGLLQEDDMATAQEIAAAVWAHMFADYVDVDVDGTRPNITCGDALFKARADSYHAHSGVDMLVGRPPVVAAPVDPAAIEAAVRRVLAEPDVLAKIADAVNDDAARRAAE